MLGHRVFEDGHNPFSLEFEGKGGVSQEIGTSGLGRFSLRNQHHSQQFQKQKKYENSRDLLDRLRDISPRYGRCRSAVGAYGHGHVWSAADAGRRSIHVDGIFSRLVRLLDRAVLCPRNSGNCWRAGADAKSERRQRLAGCGELAVALRSAGWNRDRRVHLN